MRPLCQICKKNFAAVNRKYGDKTYYRSRCSPCIRRKKKQRPQVPRWKSAGYKKKATCDRCGFRAKYASQLIVYHVNGDLNCCEFTNLKTVCLNCVAEVTRLELPWRPGDLEPDL